MSDFAIHIGIPFAFAGEIEFQPEDPSQNIGDYDLVVKITTTEGGRSIIAYSESGRSNVDLECLPGNRFIANVPASETNRLSPGYMTLTIVAVYKPTGSPAAGEFSTTVPVRKIRITESEL